MIEIDKLSAGLDEPPVERLISADASRVRCAVIPTNEERMIALDAIRLGRIHTAALAWLFIL